MSEPAFLPVAEVVAGFATRRFYADCQVGINLSVRLEMTPEAVLQTVTGHRSVGDPSIFQICNGVPVAHFMLHPQAHSA